MKQSPNWAWAGAGLIILMTLAAYVPAMRGGFVWDDDDYVTNNRTLRSVNGLVHIWFKIGATPQYYPLTFSSFWAEYRLWRLEPVGYHAVNVMLHSVNGVLLWLVLRRLSVPGAWMAAAVFALHPVHVESVAWITERKNVLSGVFYLSALLSYLCFASPDASLPRGPRRRRTYALAVFLFICAMLSKTVSLSLPAVILLLAWWKRGRVSRRDLVPLLPMFGVALVMSPITVWLETHNVGAQGTAWSYSITERGLIAGRALWFYAGKLAFPARLTFIYPKWTVDAAVWWQHLYPAAAFAAIIFLWTLRGRIGRGPLVAALFFGGTLVPALGFINVYPMRYSFVADHFMYLASIGPIALFAAVFTTGFASLSWRDRRVRRGTRALAAAPILPAVLTAILVVVLATLSWRRGTVYQDLETLWRDTIAKNPTCWMAHNNLGIVLQKRGDDEGAARHYAEALRIEPHLAQPHNNLGALLIEQGRLAEARSHLIRATDADPNYAVARYNLGHVLELQGKLTDAAESYVDALRINPNHAPAHYNLANVLAQQGDLEAALEHYLEAVRIDPDHIPARHNLGNVYASRGEFSEAARQYSEVIRVNPDHALAHKNLGHVLRETGELDGAVIHYRKALRLEPGWFDVANELAWILATHPSVEARDGQEAVRLATQACRATDYRDAAILDTLAAAYAEAGRFDQAISTAREAISHASEGSDADLRPGIEARLKLYLAGRAYTSKPGAR